LTWRIELASIRKNIDGDLKSAVLHFHSSFAACPKSVVPNGGLKFEEVGSHAQDRGGLHLIDKTVISEKLVSLHRIASRTLKNLLLLSDPATLKI
jgi:hypothetical protein